LELLPQKLRPNPSPLNQDTGFSVPQEKKKEEEEKEKEKHTKRTEQRIKNEVI